MNNVVSASVGLGWLGLPRTSSVPTTYKFTVRRKTCAL